MTLITVRLQHHLCGVGATKDITSAHCASSASNWARYTEQNTSRITWKPLPRSRNTTLTASLQQTPPHEALPGTAPTLGL